MEINKHLKITAYSSPRRPNRLPKKSREATKTAPEHMAESSAGSPVGLGCTSKYESGGDTGG